MPEFGPGPRLLLAIGEPRRRGNAGPDPRRRFIDSLQRPACLRIGMFDLVAPLKALHEPYAWGIFEA
jgi:hypothetical protein